MEKRRDANYQKFRDKLGAKSKRNELEHLGSEMLTRAAARLGVDPLKLARADVFAELVEALRAIADDRTDSIQKEDAARAALSKLPSKEGR